MTTAERTPDAGTERRVLIVEDEPNLLEALRYSLEAEGYRVLTATDGLTGLEKARAGAPDLVMLDVMLPGLDGREVCRLLRRESDVPVLMLSARGEEVDRVVGLELGADDYVTKPFSMPELLARVRAMLRRPRSGAPASSPLRTVLRAGELELDLYAHRARLAGRALELKPREFDLLALFMANPGHAFSREQILDRLWGQDYVGDVRTVDVHVRWLREKTEASPSNPARIITVRGVGYRFEA